MRPELMHRLDLLGPPRLTRPDGTPAELALGKPFAVLVFLALTDTPPTRKELARLFWPGSEARNARQSVRQALSILRRAIHPDLFSSDDPVKLGAGVLLTDVDRLREAIEQGDVEAAESAWRGRFMQEFALSDAPEWTRWAETLEMALEAALVQMLASDAEAHRQRGDVDLAIARLQKAIGIDPYREGLHSDLLDLYLDAGRMSKAAGTIGRARELLGPDTPVVERMATRLERRLRRKDPAASGNGGDQDRAIALDPKTASRLRTELVGRTREMSLLLHAWRRAEGGSPAVIVLTGPAGIGKTRLTEELADLTGGEGAAVVRVTAERGERSLEWGLIAELSRKMAALPGTGQVDPAAAATLRRLSPSIPVGPESPTVGLEPTPVAGSVTALVLGVARQQPLLLVVDEAQWADGCSRAVLSRLARSLDAARCALIVCLQDEETGDQERDFIAALGRAEGAVRLELAALSDADVREMISLMVDLPEENAHSFRESLAAAAGGNPLYLTEVLRALVEDGTLVEAPEGLSLAGERVPDPLPLPRSVQEILHHRLEALSDPAIAFAAHLARLGGKARLVEVKERSQLSEGALARAAGELLATGVVLWSDPELVTFSHDRLRRAVLEDFPVGARSRARAWWRDPRVAAAMLVAVLAAVAFAISGGFGPGSSGQEPGSRGGEGRGPGSPVTAGRADAPGGAAPYGGGLLLVLPADSLMWEIDLRQGPPSEWRARPPRFWYPRATERAGPFRLASGDTVWYVRGYAPDAPPTIVEIREDGTRTEIVRMEGDVNLPSVSPGGRFMTYAAQDPNAENYSHDLWVARTDASDARKILEHDGKLLNPAWSPNGRYVLTSVAGPADTMLVLTPGGERVATVTADQISTPTWCGATDTLVNVVRLGEERFILILDVGTGEASYRPDPDLLFTGIACSPDGSALLYDRAVEGEPRRVLHDLETGAVQQLLQYTFPHLIRWLPDPGFAAPTDVRLERERMTLAWGASETMAYEVVMSDSSVTALSVRWTSSDPEVASVSVEGRVSANLPGRTWIHATLDGWLADSARVTVTEGRPAQLRFHETFSSLDPERWHEVGFPAPRSVMLDDGPALSLEGDGVYKDGIVSRERFSLAAGATLELSFRMTLTRVNQQRLIVNLIDGDPLPGSEDLYPGGWSQGTILGFSYPASEDVRFDPTEMQAGFGTGEHQSVFLPDLLPTPNWVHLAIQVRPDGSTQLYVNRRLVATSRLRMDLNPDQRFRVALLGAAVDTELYVRNVSLWEGVRY